MRLESLQGYDSTRIMTWEMTTPALGTLISVAKTEQVAAAYAATYPIALLSVVVISQVIILVLS